MPARWRNMASTGPEIPQPTIKALRPVALYTGHSLLRIEDLPQQVRDRPDQERSRVATYRPDPGVLERGEAPLAPIARGDEGLDRVALRRGPALASHHGAAHRVHHGHVGAQEPHVPYLPHEARPLHPPVEEPLVGRFDLPSSLEVRAIERDEVAILREGRGEGGAAALIPAI